MKRILVLLFLTVGCSSTTRYYHASDVSSELKKNSTQLETMVSAVESDYADKAAYYKKYTEETGNKNTFILQDLGWRLQDMKAKKEAVVAKSEYINSVNDQLLLELRNKKNIKEKDPAFKKIESFSSAIVKDANDLYQEYTSYKTASEEFGNFAMFSGNMWKKSTSTKRR